MDPLQDKDRGSSIGQSCVPRPAGPGADGAAGGAGPGRVDWPTPAQRFEAGGGTIFSANIYQGAPPELRGKVKYQRVLHIEQKTYTYEPYLMLIGRPGSGRDDAAPAPPPPGCDLAGTLKVENFDPFDPAAYRTPPPMTRLTFKSQLVELASSGNHHKVKVDPYSLLRLILWADTMCTYLTDEDIHAMEYPKFQGSDWLALKPRLKSAPVVVRPGPFTAHE